MASEQTAIVRDHGFTLLHDPTDPIADIIFIHGLQGHPFRTWTRKIEIPKGKPKRKQRESFWGRVGIKKSLVEPEQETVYTDNEVFWPRDLLAKDYPRTRIWTYGYDSKVTQWFRGPASQLDIFSYSESILNGLVARRLDQPSRSLIFIVHSLGGLVLKEVLRRARTAIKPSEKAIYDSLHALVFFGVPHRGGSYVDLGLTVRKLVAGIGFDASDRVLRDLRFDSSTAKLLREEFAKVLDEKSPLVFTFQEAFGLTGFGPLSGKVVEDSSSALDYAREQKDFIRANHMGMCRFSGTDDDGYDKVRSAMKLCLLPLADQQTPPISSNSVRIASLTPEQKACLQSLFFPEMCDRRMDVDPPTENTCKWLISHKAYNMWLGESHSMLWLNGKPGAGKSTLLKYAIDLIEKESNDSLLILSHFFHGRGHNNQKSALGFWQSTLHQLLQRSSVCLDKITALYVERTSVRGEFGKVWQWNERELQTFVIDCLSTLNNVSSVHLYVDAVDEAGETAARQLLRSWKALLSESKDYTKSFRICFTCRHWPLMTVAGAHEICVEEENTHDIKTYIISKIGCEFQSADDVDNIVLDVTAKAEGVFQWVKLKIDRVLLLHARSESSQAIRKDIQTTRSELTSIYKDLVSEIDMDDRPQALLLFQWLCFSEHNLEPKQLWTAKILSQSNDLIPDSTIAEIDSLDSSFVERRIQHLSAGLAEIVPGKDLMVHVKEDDKRMLFHEQRCVRLIHHSALEFLLEKGLELLSYSSNPNIVGDSHFLLFQSCLRYMRNNSVRTLIHSRDNVDAVDARLYRADQYYAKVSVEPQHHFHQLFSEESLKKVDGMEKGKILPEDPTAWTRWQTWQSQRESICKAAPFVHYASNHWASHLQAAESEGLSSKKLTDLEKELLDFPTEWARLARLTRAVRRHQYPCFGFTLTHMAAMEGLICLLRLCIEHRKDLESIDAGGRIPLHFASITGDPTAVQLLLSTYETNINIADQDKLTPFGYACESGDISVVQLFLDHDGFAVEDDQSDMHPILFATNNGSTSIVELLLRYGVNPDVCDEYGHSALSYAIQSDDSPLVVNMLRGSNVNLTDSEGYTPLMQSMLARKPKHIIQLLLAGASIDAQDMLGNTALQLAVQAQCEDSVLQLLKWGASPGITNRSGHTPLHYAAQLPSSLIVGHLISYRADLEAYCNMGSTALHEAASDGMVDNVVLLLEHGANVNTQKPEEGTTPLWVAVLACHEDVAQVLLDGGADVNLPDHRLLTPLMIAVEKLSLGLVRMLLRQNPEVNFQHRGGHTALLILIMTLSMQKKDFMYNQSSRWIGPDDPIQIARLLLESGADIHIPIGDSRTTPLGYAVLTGRTEISKEMIKEMITSQPNFDMEYMMLSEKQTLLQLFAKWGWTDFVEFLICRGSNIEAKDLEGNTPLLLASMAGTWGTVDCLLRHGAKVHAQDNHGRTPIFLAAARDIGSRIKIESEAEEEEEEEEEEYQDADNEPEPEPKPEEEYQDAKDGSERESDHEDAEADSEQVEEDEDAEVAFEAGEEECLKREWSMILIMEELYKYGANVNDLDNDGTTILSHAKNDGKRAMVRWLLEHGAQENTRDATVEECECCGT